MLFERDQKNTQDSHTMWLLTQQANVQLTNNTTSFDIVDREMAGSTSVRSTIHTVKNAASPHNHCINFVIFTTNIFTKSKKIWRISYSLEYGSRVNMKLFLSLEAILQR